MNKNRITFSTIYIVHYCKLVWRSLLFAAAVTLYIICHIKGSPLSFGGLENNSFVLALIWIAFVFEMLMRFIPSRFESMGCQKVFAKNYIPKNTAVSPKIQPAKVTLLVLAVWLLLNGAIGLLYFLNIIDKSILFLICLAYSVCDVICILFFCPFQTWFMKNKCCTSCRIYNWDFAMMFTPLVFIPDAYTWSLLGIALLLLLKWEITVYRHPERFSETTNKCLSCANCEEKLCHHKKQLRRFIEKNKATLRLYGNDFFGKRESDK